MARCITIFQKSKSEKLSAKKGKNRLRNKTGDDFGRNWKVENPVNTFFCNVGNFD